MKRTNLSSGAPWEAQVGYSRAVRIGPHLEISGTVAVDEAGHLVGEGDAYAQAAFILRKLEVILGQMGATLQDVLRTRIYVTDISQWAEVGRAHGQFFGESRPATSMVEVSGLIEPGYLVEIEVTAIVPD